MSADELFLPIGHVSPSPALLEAALDNGVRDPARATAVLRRHRVVGIGAARLRENVGAGSAALEELVARHERKRTRLDEVWKQLAVGVEEIGISAAGIKGYSVRSLYSQPEHRDTADVDLMVAHCDDAWRLTQWLRQFGFDWHEWELPWLKRDSRTGALYGQAAVWRFEADEPVRVDIHFGGYSIRHCRLLPCEVTEPGLHVLDPMRNLPMLLGNAAGDYLIRLKDVNDIVVMLEARPTLDWEPALAVVGRYGLDRFWNALLRYAIQAADLSDHARRLADGLVITSSGTERVPIGEQVWRARCRATAVDAYRAGRDGGVGNALRLFWSAYRYYRRPLRLSVTNRCRHDGELLDIVQNMRNDQCVRLVPTRLVRALTDSPAAPSDRIAVTDVGMAVPGSAVLREVLVDRHVFVRAFDDVFAPTVMYDLCPRQAAEVS